MTHGLSHGACFDPPTVSQQVSQGQLPRTGPSTPVHKSEEDACSHMLMASMGDVFAEMSVHPLFIAMA